MEKSYREEHWCIRLRGKKGHEDNGVVDIIKIESKSNYGDPLTKGLNSTENGSFFYELLIN